MQEYCVATVGCDPAWPLDPESLMSGVGPVVTFVAGRRRGEFGDLVTHANTCAGTRGARIPSRAGALYGRMRICSSDTAALGRAHLIAEPFPRRLRTTSFRSHRVDHPPRSHRRRVPTCMTLPTHLRSVDLSAWSLTSFRRARVQPWLLDSRSPDGWVMRGDK